jgi:hypothetical protein
MTGYYFSLVPSLRSLIELIECPTALLPFITIQHAHFCFKQIPARSCLQIEQIHGCAKRVAIFFCRLEFSSTYNHNKIKGIPITKNMLIVRTGRRKTNKNIPKHNVANPRAESQRFVRLSINTSMHLSNIRHFVLFLLLSLFIFCVGFSYSIISLVWGKPFALSS